MRVVARPQGRVALAPTGPQGRLWQERVGADNSRRLWREVSEKNDYRTSLSASILIEAHVLTNTKRNVRK